MNRTFCLIVRNLQSFGLGGSEGLALLPRESGGTHSQLVPFYNCDLLRPPSNSLYS